MNYVIEQEFVDSINFEKCICLLLSSHQSLKLGDRIDFLHISDVSESKGRHYIVSSWFVELLQKVWDENNLLDRLLLVKAIDWLRN